MRIYMDCDVRGIYNSRDLTTTEVYRISQALAMMAPGKFRTSVRKICGVEV